jgi:hypothetical protein
MATRAFTNVTRQQFGAPLSLNNGPLVITVFRAQGGTVGDTTTIPAADDLARIVGAFGNLPATSDISTSGGTQVVFTHTGGTAASTSAAYDVYLFGYRRT